jgi:acid phosphatase
MVVEENHSYSSVIGSSAMPYLNSLASKYGLATQYYANTHPAIGNHFEMTTGLVLTNDDTLTPARFPVSEDSIVRELMVAGKTWKSYAEGLPYAGYTGGDTGSYAVRNNPFAYFTDVQNSSTQKLNLVPFTQFATDLASNELPNFSYVVPNLLNDGYSGSLQRADGWLKQNIAPLLANPQFQQDGLLIIAFEESDSSDKVHGGGHVATLVIGPKAVVGYKSTKLYQHQSLLRTVLTTLGATSFPGAAATAAPMNEFFTQTATPVSPINPLAPVADAASSAVTASAQAAATTAVSGVTISSPSNGATVSSPVQFVASAVSSSKTYPITAMRIYVDGIIKYNVGAASLNTSLALAFGKHNVTIVAWDKSGKSYAKSINITVGSSAPVTAGGVTISSPANGSTVSSPVQFVASAKASTGKTITAMWIYVDNESAYAVDAASLNTSLKLASGAHYIVVQAWDNTGAVYKAAENITVTSSAPAVGTLSLSSSSLSFGSVNVGSSSSQSLTVKANTAAVTISQANASAGFTVSGLTLPLTLAAGQSASFPVKFTPTTSGAVSGSLSLVSNASNSTATVALSGTGAEVSTTGTLSLSSSSLSFGSVNVGSSSSQTVTVKANTAAVTISQANATTGFTVSGLTLPLTLAAGQSASFSVKFAPTTSGAVSGSLTLVSNASNSTATVALSGTGAEVSTTGTLSVSTTSLSFGSVNVGSSSSQTVTVKANTAAVTISKATATTGFTVSGLTLPLTLTAGQSASFSVKFTPTASGAVSGSLTLVSNASNSVAPVALSGTGAPAASTTPPASTPPSVAVKWSASTSSDVSGYNVYRGTVAGTYSKIDSMDTSMSYTDSSVSAGSTYYYVVTSVSSAGVESAYSTPATAVVPAS